MNASGGFIGSRADDAGCVRRKTGSIRREDSLVGWSEALPIICAADTELMGFAARYRSDYGSAASSVAHLISERFDLPPECLETLMRFRLRCTSYGGQVAPINLSKSLPEEFSSTL